MEFLDHGLLALPYKDTLALRTKYVGLTIDYLYDQMIDDKDSEEIIDKIIHQVVERARELENTVWIVDNGGEYYRSI